MERPPPLAETPQKLIDYLLFVRKYTKISQLAKRLGTPTDRFIKFVNKERGLSAEVIVRILELYPELSLSKLKSLAGIGEYSR
jgi:hypothetical protein